MSGDKKPPRWAQPPEERDTRRASVLPRDLRDFYDDLNEVTPPPFKPSAEDAWHHASNISKRNANMLAEIAHSSGVGMSVGEDVGNLKDQVAKHDKKLKWWQALIIAAITAAGSSLIGVAKGLYEKGEHEGVMEMRLRVLELNSERSYIQIEKLRDEVYRLTRHHAEPTPVKREP